MRETVKRKPRPTITITEQGEMHVFEDSLVPMDESKNPKELYDSDTHRKALDRDREISQTEMKLRSRADQLCQSANRAQINTSDDVEKGVDLAKYIRVAKAKLEDERKMITKPFRDGIKAIDDRFKIFINQLADAQGVIDKKIIAFKRKEDEEARARAEIARKSTEVEMPVDYDDEPPFIAPPIQMPAPTRGNLGTGSMVTRYDFKVVDISKVPLDLLLVDAVEVRRRINGKEKIDKIDGLDILEVQSLTVR